MELIYREDVIKKLNEIYVYFNSFRKYDYCGIISGAIDSIKEIPKTDGFVHAKWINKKGKIKCSNCDCFARWKQGTGGFWEMDDSNYCPHCGAKMEYEYIEQEDD